jgi:hypothetical protein
MVLRWMTFAGLITLCSVAAAGQTQAAPTPAEILHRLEQTTHEGFERAPGFDYCMTEDHGDKTKTYAVFMMEGSTYHQLVAVDGVALPAEDLAKLAPARKAEAERRSHETPEEREKRVAQYEQEQHRNRALLREMTKAFDFTLRGKTQKDGLETYVFDVTPRSGYQPKDRLTKVLTGMEGKLWVGEQTFGWVRAEATVVRPVSIQGFLARVEKGTRFTMEERPFGDGIWLPTLFSYQTRAHILFIFPHNSTTEYTFFHYVPRGTLQPEMCLSQTKPQAAGTDRTPGPER